MDNAILLIVILVVATVVLAVIALPIIALVISIHLKGKLDARVSALDARLNASPFGETHHSPGIHDNSLAAAVLRLENRVQEIESALAGAQFQHQADVKTSPSVAFGQPGPNGESTSQSEP